MLKTHNFVGANTHIRPFGVSYSVDVLGEATNLKSLEIRFGVGRGPVRRRCATFDTV